MGAFCILLPWYKDLASVIIFKKKKALETDLEVKAYALWDRLIKKTEENA